MGPKYRSKNIYSIHAVSNALEFLNALCDEGDSEGIRLSSLGARLGLAKSSVYRLLMTFEDWGFVEREPVSGRFRLGLSAYEMGQKVLLRMGLRQKARPVMEELARECGEAVYLAVRRDRGCLLLDLAESSQRVKVVSLLGRQFPLEQCAAGQLFLAYPVATAANRNQAPAAAAMDLRRKGYCIDQGGLGEGIFSLAVPLLRDAETIVACLCMVGPAFRMSEPHLTLNLVPELREAGDAICRQLGHLRAQGKLRL